MKIFNKKNVFVVIIYSITVFSYSDDVPIEKASKLARDGNYYEAYLILNAELEAKNVENKNLKELVSFYQKKLKKIESTLPDYDISTKEIESSRRLYREAWDLQRTAVFKKYGNEKEEMLEKAIEKYREVISLYPKTREADESQYRIGRIYSKFLKDYKKAKEEFNKYLEFYPRGEFMAEVLDELKNNFY